MSKQPVIYYQTDPRWANNDYSAKGEKTTIAKSGCGPSSLAMILATWANPSVTPATECAWALKNGYKAPHQGTYYSYFVPACERFGLIAKRLNFASIYGNNKSQHHKTAQEAVNAGNYVIACMGPGTWTRSGHYIVVWKIEGNTIYINDPASSRPARIRGNYETFKKEVKYYWIVYNPNKQKEEPDMTEKETKKLIAEELKEFEKKLEEKTYNTLEEVPDYARPLITAMVKRGNIKGTGKGLGLHEDLVRLLVILDREGLFYR